MFCCDTTAHESQQHPRQNELLTQEEKLLGVCTSPALCWKLCWMQTWLVLGGEDWKTVVIFTMLSGFCGAGSWSLKLVVFVVNTDKLPWICPELQV